MKKGENSADDDRYNKEIGMKSIISLIGATLLSVMPAFANIAEGVSGDCKWVSDNDGNLSISSEIDNAVLGTWEGDSAPWSNFKEEITTVVFSTPVIAKTCTNMFNGCTNLRYIYLDNFYTNEVTDMSNMFANCASLEIVEFNMTSSSFDDDDAFACYSKGLVSDRGNFITSSVKTMAGMFSGCKSLLSFYLPNLDMHSVTDFSEMFADCSSLESMDLTTLTIPKNANVSNMFRNCRNLMNIINQNPDVKVAAEVLGEADSTTTQEALLNILSSLPEIDAVVTHCGADSMGVVNAFESMGMEVPITIGDNTGNLAVFNGNGDTLLGLADLNDSIGNLLTERDNG